MRGALFHCLWESRLVWLFQGAAVVRRETLCANPDVLAVLLLGMGQRETIKSLHMETCTRMLIALMWEMWGAESTMGVLF